MTNPVLDVARSEFLKARSAASEDKGTLPAWPRPLKRLPIVDLEVDWVRFSTLNHRTKAEQKREIQKRQLPGLFSSDPLGLQAQEAQFKILAAQEGFEDLRNDLKKRRQQEPAVVTADGVLINGNRRTAALRSLYMELESQDARYVRCLVLPDDATSAEILDLETELQIAKDFKEGYSWINEALLIEELFEKDRNFEKLAVKMHRLVPDVRSMYEKIQQVNQLVELSKGIKYHIDFEPHESAFDELTKHIKNKSPQESESVRTAYFLGTLSGVTYRDLRYLRRPDASNLVIQEIKSDPNIASLLQAAEPPKPNGSDGIDLLDDILGESENNPLSEILSYVVSKDNSDTVLLPDTGSVTVQMLLGTLGQKIKAAATESKEEQRDQNALEAPVQRLEDAILDVNRSKQTLGRARTLAGWSEDNYLAKIKVLKAAIVALEQAL